MSNDSDKLAHMVEEQKRIIAKLRGRLDLCETLLRTMAYGGYSKDEMVAMFTKYKSE